MLAFLPEFFIQLDKPGILNVKSKGYRLSMSPWNKVYDNEDWFFNTESCVLPLQNKPGIFWLFPEFFLEYDRKDF